MVITETLTARKPPLELYEGKTLRVCGTRVPLERIIYAFNQGSGPEEIVHRFPILNLADVYDIIGYYLHNRDQVDAYVRQREQEADEIERATRAQFPDDGFAERLLARQPPRR